MGIFGLFPFFQESNWEVSLLNTPISVAWSSCALHVGGFTNQESDLRWVNHSLTAPLCIGIQRIFHSLDSDSLDYFGAFQDLVVSLSPRARVFRLRRSLGDTRWGR